MQGQDYLNQISMYNRPVKKTRTGIFKSKIFMVSMIGIIALIVIIIIGAIISGSKSGEKNLSLTLKLHLDNTASVISEYQPRLKSSDLRSLSASLTSVISNTSRELTDYLTSKYNYKDNEVDKNLVDEANLLKDGLEADLFEARINGNLDRIYAHKMVFEISSFMNEETKLINTTSDSSYKDLLIKSYNSFKNLSDGFSNFSETK